MSSELTCVISGTFKFKKEIDELYEAFADHGVTVLEPSPGWWWSPNEHFEPGEVRPLPAERHMRPEDIEPRFDAAQAVAHFVYLNNLEGYIGDMSRREVRIGLNRGQPIYARQSVDIAAIAKGDPEIEAKAEAGIIVAGLAQIVEIERSRLEG